MKKGYINCNIWQNPATAFATSDEYIIKVGTNQEIELPLFWLLNLIFNLPFYLLRTIKA